MTNEQTAVMLGGYLAEIQLILDNSPDYILEQKEIKDILALRNRLEVDIAVLKCSDAIPIFDGGE